MSIEKQEDKWNKENSMDRKDNSIPPSYPNEVMVKSFSSSYYSSTFCPVEKGQKVIDVGCGFGNNLVYFLDRNCEGCGIEVTPDMIDLAKDNLKRLGYDNYDIKYGTNIDVPFDDNVFDVLLSVNAVHYSQGQSGIKKSLSEFKRVLKDEGRAFIMTAGPHHVIVEQSKRHGMFDWEVEDYGFRTGNRMSFFDGEEHFKDVLSQYFDGVEVGRVTEQYSTVKLDFMFSTCTVRK